MALGSAARSRPRSPKRTPTRPDNCAYSPSMESLTMCPLQRCMRRTSLAPRSSRQRSLPLVCKANKDPNSLFVFGLGYTGLAAANYFQQRGWDVAGTCRTEEKQRVLRSRGFQAFTFDADGYQQLDREALAALQRSTHVLTTVPPDGDSDPVLLAHSRHLAERGDGLRWLGYISSTSVYGDHRGEWVDEDSELLAAHGKGLSRMMTENAWLQLHYEFGTPVHVFRCGGIYGPRRSAVEAARAAGSATTAQARRGRQRYTSRCHVLDICKVVEASMAAPSPATVYNVVDDDPAGRAEVVGFAASLLAGQMASFNQEAPAAPGVGRRGSGGSSGGAGLDSYDSGDEGCAAASPGPSPPHPQQQEREQEQQEAESVADDSGSEGGRERSRALRESGGGAAHLDEKRVRNELIKRALRVELAFPTYREGIAALVSGDMRPFD